MKLKELRLLHNKTQADIATFLNVSQVTYGRYELGITEPTIEQLKMLADYFEVSLDYLCGRRFNNQIGFVPDERKEIVVEMLKLSDEDVAKLYGYIRALNDK